MTPTPKLRFVARIQGTQVVKVLQQWWEVVFFDDNKQAQIATGEWRDVPLEKEQ